MKNSEILRQARALAMNPDTSCTGVLARDRAGYSVDVFDVDACRFCAVGAMSKVLRKDRDSENIRVDHPAFVLLERAAAQLSKKHDRFMAVYEIHDRRNRPLSEEMWDTAIALAEAEEAEHA